MLRSLSRIRPRTGRGLAFTRWLYIQTASTPNEDALKFLPSQQLLGAGAQTIEMLSAKDAAISPLAAKLFTVPGVRGVLLGPDFVTVEKEAESQWAQLKPELHALLSEHLVSGEPVLDLESTPAVDTAYDENDSEAVGLIKELIETRIRPAIQEDGGDIQFRGFEDGIVKLKLQGACRSCDSSALTLKNGIEAMLMHYVEEVKGTEQVMDDEEVVAQAEFEKLESALAARHARDHAAEVNK